MNRGANVKEQTKTIWKLRLEGNNSVEIADLLGRGKEAGEIPKPKTNPLLYNNPNYIKMGSIGGIINTLNHEQLIWLTDEAHGLGCETIAEMILEIVRDAYEETRGGI